MLTTDTRRLEESAAERLGASNENTGGSRSSRGWLDQVLTVEWLGQSVASICWIASVFCYGIQSVGDWLQLAAASAWLVANIASVLSVEAD